MIFSRLTRRRRSSAIEPLYGAMMARALSPALFASGDAPDTFEGRFESVALHAALVLRRLKALPPPAGETAQALVDRTFDGFDSAMRQVGISDVGVPRRMKKFGQGFYGRLGAYDAALATRGPEAAIGEALSRNMLDGAPCPAWLARYVVDLAAALDRVDLAALERGALPDVAMGGSHV